MTSNSKILRVDASGRHDGSHSRALADHLLARFGDAEVTRRDLTEGIPFVDEAWIGANFTPEEERSDAQKAALALSDSLVAELEAAEILVIATPIYNFGVPAKLKAWIDMVARARKTFAYTPEGPVGLLKGKKAYVALVSGGTEIGSDADFASGYLKQILAFIGIDDVTIFTADQLMARGEDRVAEARRSIDAVLAV